ncbi:MAG: pirin family protein [Bdellovibrionia bacterium]
MIQVRKSKERGHANHGWLDSYHTFSFADYYDPEHMGFATLRVINEDWVEAGQGFGTHPHRDMEIITYVLEGAIRHKDSMGNTSVIKPGDVQRMTAGTGVTHSEFNDSPKDKLHLLQIWILPESRGLKPSYEQKNFTTDDKRNRLRLIASRDGADGSVVVHQDVKLFAAHLEAGKTLEYSLEPGRRGWVQVAKGKIELSGKELGSGDGAAVVEGGKLVFRGIESSSEFLFFDLIDQ